MRPPYDWKETLKMIGRRFGPTPPLANGPISGRITVHAVPTEYRIGFVGDIGPALGRAVEVSSSVRSFYSDCDWMVGNLEGILTDRSWSPYRQPIREDVWELLAALRPLDRWALSLANNHALDYGPEGLEASARRCEERGVAWFGLAARPRISLEPELTVTGWTRWLNGSHTGLLAREDPGDLPETGLHLACPHWGYEHERTPRTSQRRSLPSGYGAVVGHHSHLPQPVEQVGADRIVAWSLGNFVTGKLLRKLGEGLALRLGVGEDAGGELVITEARYRHLRIERPYHRRSCRIDWYERS